MGPASYTKWLPKEARGLQEFGSHVATCIHVLLSLRLLCRCSVSWSPDRNPVDPDVAAGMSTGFIAQLHDFALGFPGARPSRCGPDEYAVPQLNSNVPCKCLWQVHGTMTSVSGLPQIDSGGLIVASPEAS